jgi:hypothetical protein
MYMSDLRHIHDPVLSSLKMEGIRLLLSKNVTQKRQIRRYIRRRTVFIYLVTKRPLQSLVTQTIEILVGNIC